MVLSKLKLSGSKLDELTAILDFFSEQGSPSRVTGFYRDDRFSPVDRVEGHIADV